MRTISSIILNSYTFVQGYQAEQPEDIPYRGETRSTPDILSADRISS